LAGLYARRDGAIDTRRSWLTSLAHNRITSSTRGGQPLEDWLVGALAHGLGIDYADRLNGLDDLRRYVYLLRDGIRSTGPWGSVEELYGQVVRIVTAQPYRLGHELVNALGSAAAIEGERLVYDLCAAMQRRAMTNPSEGMTGRRAFALRSTSRTIEAEFYVPTPDASRVPILIVLHGVRRNPGQYLEPWLSFASANGYAVIAPHFSRNDFPGSSAYNQGDLFSSDGQLRPRERWAFHVIEDLFDTVRDWIGSNVPRYALYGHSAGAQFIHRMLMLCPESRASIAIAANAGWYTMPTFDLEYPYGLNGLSLAGEHLRRALEARLVLLLGEKDSDPNDPTLRKSDLALEQGAHRFERGLGFYQTAVEAASKWGVSLGWKEQRVPGVGHDQEAMAVIASSILVESKR
jgi:dienelactone hydrolase